MPYKKLLNDLNILLRNGLYHSVETFISFSLNQLQNSDYFPLFLVVYGDALAQSGQHEMSECIYKKALQASKALGQTSLPVFSMDPIEEDDFYCKLAQAQIARKNYDAAIQSLLTVPIQKRNIKVNYLLVKMYNIKGNNEVISEIKEIIRSHPLSCLELIPIMFNYSSKNLKDVLLLVQQSLGDRLHFLVYSWILPWTKLKWFEMSFSNDKTQLQQIVMDLQAIVGSPPILMSVIAVCQYNLGDLETARLNFFDARQREPLLVYGSCKYASILHSRNDVKALDILATSLTNISEKIPETWVALGYFCLATGKPNKISRVLYLAQKAFLISNTCFDSLLLKGKALSSPEMGRIEDAVNHYKEVIRFWPGCFEAHQGIVMCQLQLSPRDSFKQALVAASAACKLLNNSARSLALLARVLDRAGPATREKSHTFVDRALSQDPKYLEAILLKVDLLISDKKCGDAVAFLKAKLEHQNDPQLHDKLSFAYTTWGLKEEATVHKNIYFSLMRLKEGDNELRCLDRQTMGPKQSSNDGSSIHLEDESTLFDLQEVSF